MLITKPTAAFKRDLQRIASRGWSGSSLSTPLILLQNSRPLPPQYRDHPLKGQWAGCREFHVTPDWLVIYRITDDFLVLFRTGTRADLFKK